MHNIKIIDNFISKEDAESLIREQLSPSEINPYPEYYKTRYGGTAFPYNKTVMNILVKYGKLANQTHKELFNILNKEIYVYKSFGSIWYPGQAGGIHTDSHEPEFWTEWSTVIYLNDDFTGGEIYFPKQNFSYKPKKYSAVFFPSSGTKYVHGISEVLSGIRHTALYMHTSDKLYADPDFLLESNR